MKNHLNQAVYGAKRSAIRQFSALAAATPGCMALTLGEPDFDSPQSVIDSACLSLNSGETHYIPNNGSLALRQRIAQFERERNGMDYSEDEIIVTAGATEALFVALFGVLNPGDEVIIPVPAFVLYEEIVKLCRGIPVLMDTKADGFQITEENLSAHMSERTKTIILNTPNNPTGCVYTRDSLEVVHRCVAGKSVFVVCDDVYRQLIYTEDYCSFAQYRDLREQLLVVQSFSKPYAMTGWRVGYLMADYSVKERLELLHQFMVVSAPAPFQKACREALNFDPSVLVETYTRRRNYVLSRLREMGLPVTEPLGAFYVFPSIESYGLPSDEFCIRMIKEAGLAATPGSCFGGEGHIRLSYCYSDDVLEEGLNRLESFLHKLEGERH